MALCDEKDFGVESPAVDLLERKEFFRRLGRKTFKSALRVLEIPDRQNSYDPIKDPSGKMAELRFVVADRALRFARSDRDVVIGF